MDVLTLFARLNYLALLLHLSAPVEPKRHSAISRFLYLSTCLLSVSAPQAHLTYETVEVLAAWKALEQQSAIRALMFGLHANAIRPEHNLPPREDSLRFCWPSWSRSRDTADTVRGACAGPKTRPERCSKNMLAALVASPR